MQRTFNAVNMEAGVRMVSKLSLITASVMILVSGSLQAEEPKQTPESAQSFFDMVIKQGGVTLTMDSNWFRTRARNCDRGCGPWSEWAHSQHEPYKVISAQGQANKVGSYCGTNFYATIKSGVHPDEHYQYEYAPPQPPLLVSWNSVSKVEQVGETVVLKGKPSFVIRFSSDQLATRAAYAMEFLRLSCDTTASTGF